MEQNSDKDSNHYFYHYTTQDTICSMLNKYRENMNTGSLFFCACSIPTMNYLQEMKHGADVYKVLVLTNEISCEILKVHLLNLFSKRIWLIIATFLFFTKASSFDFEVISI